MHRSQASSDWAFWLGFLAVLIVIGVTAGLGWALVAGGGALVALAGLNIAFGDFGSCEWKL